MATITTRAGKGTPLTNAELDANFTNLNSDKLETADASVTNSREWTATTVTQAEAEAGTATTRRAWTAQRVRQAIATWWEGVRTGSVRLMNQQKASYDEYTFAWGGSTDKAWKRLATFSSSSTAGYLGSSGWVAFYDENSNYGNGLRTVKCAKFRVHYANNSTPMDEAFIEGSSGASDVIRLRKIGTRNYELQVRQQFDWRLVGARLQVDHDVGSTSHVADTVVPPNGSAGVSDVTMGVMTEDVNVLTATTLQTPRAINGTDFNGSAAITTANWGTSRNLSIGGTSKAVDGSAAVTWTEAEIAANTAVTLKTTRAINGTNFNGSAAITTANWGTSRNLSIGGTSKAVDGSAAVTWTEAEIAANTAVTLKTTRAINGTDFNGSAAITTANWGTARTLTIGATGKSVNGSAAVSWTLAELGAAATGTANTFSGKQIVSATSGIMDTSTGSHGQVEIQNAASGPAMIAFHRTGAYAAYFGLHTDNVWRVGGWSMGAVAHAIYHEGRKPTAGDVGAPPNARTITAGNGLSGGGDLSADRTLTLGTPTSCTASSTNSVAASAHTHAIDSTIARSAITITTGIGIVGGGNLTANRTFDLDTTAAGVGTYAFLENLSSTSRIHGDTLAGSSLEWTSVNGSIGGGGGSPAGTWRCMGNATGTGSTAQWRRTVWMRIS
jgi:hypothetical protein